MTPGETWYREKLIASQKEIEDLRRAKVSREFEELRRGVEEIGKAVKSIAIAIVDHYKRDLRVAEEEHNLLQSLSSTLGNVYEIMKVLGHDIDKKTNVHISLPQLSRELARDPDELTASRPREEDRTDSGDSGHACHNCGPSSGSRQLTEFVPGAFRSSTRPWGNGDLTPFVVKGYLCPNCGLFEPDSWIPPIEMETKYDEDPPA